MKRRVDITIEEKKKGLFGTKVVRETRTATMEEKEYRRLKNKLDAGKSITLGDLLMYDCIFDD